MNCRNGEVRCSSGGLSPVGIKQTSFFTITVPLGATLPPRSRSAQILCPLTLLRHAGDQINLCRTSFADRIFWAIGPSPSSLIARGVAATTPIQPAAPHQNSHFVNSAKSESRMRISGSVRVSRNPTRRLIRQRRSSASFSTREQTQLLYNQIKKSPRQDPLRRKRVSVRIGSRSHRRLLFLTSTRVPNSIYDRGYPPSREKAMAEFTERWLT